MRRIDIVAYAVLGTLVVASASAAAIYRQKYLGLKADPQKLAEESVKGIVSEVAALMQLPSDETPTVATVSDPERLRDQAFFRDAKEGDKVLIYTDAKKAILYDPVGKKIVEVAPLLLNDAVSEAATE